MRTEIKVLEVGYGKFCAFIYAILPNTDVPLMIGSAYGASYHLDDKWIDRKMKFYMRNREGLLSFICDVAVTNVRYKKGYEIVLECD